MRVCSLALATILLLCVLGNVGSKSGANKAPVMENDSRVEVQLEGNGLENEYDWRNDLGRLTEYFEQFMEGEPQAHPLFENAMNQIRPGQSLDYYRGHFEAVASTMNLFPILKQSIAQHNGCAPEDVSLADFEGFMMDVLKIQAGVGISRILKRWPSDSDDAE